MGVAHDPKRFALVKVPPLAQGRLAGRPPGGSGGRDVVVVVVARLHERRALHLREADRPGRRTPSLSRLRARTRLGQSGEQMRWTTSMAPGWVNMAKLPGIPTSGMLTAESPRRLARTSLMTARFVLMRCLREISLSWLGARLPIQAVCENDRRHRGVAGSCGQYVTP